MNKKLFVLKDKLKWFVDVPFSLKDEFKYSFDAVKWSPFDDKITKSVIKDNSLPDKFWHCAYTQRNEFQFQRLSGKPVYQIYDKHLSIKLPESVDSLLWDRLWSHQQLMYWHTEIRKRSIIAAQPRTGKTFPQLLLKPDLFVTRKSAKSGILKECKKWGLHIPEVITYNHFTDHIDEYLNIPPYRVVFDECHALKNYDGYKVKSSKRAKAAMALSEKMLEYYPDGGYITLMSGTPAPKMPTEWWALCEIARPGFFSAKLKVLFANELGEFDNTQGYPVLKKWYPEKIKELPIRMAGLTLSIWKKDCLDLPDMIYEVATANPTDEQLEMVEVIKAIPERNKGAQLRLTLREIADGFLYYKVPQIDGTFKTEVQTFKTGKDELFLNYLDEFSEIGRLVVYAGFTQTIEKLIDLAVKEGWSVLRIDGKAVKTYNTEYDVTFCESEMDRSLDTGTINKLIVVAQMDAASTGREFSASPIQLAYSNGEYSDAREQAENRIHSANMDKERGATWVDFECMPIDKKIRECLMNKMNIQQIGMGDLEAAMNFEQSGKTNKFSRIKELLAQKGLL